MPRLCMLLLLLLAAVVVTATHVDLHQLIAGNHTLVKRSPYTAYGSRGCLDLRSKRYISDGFCTTVRPVAEAVCVARCLEPFEASNSDVAESTTQVEWRCTQGATRRKMIRFLCRDGSRRVYQIRLVTKCDCKKFSVTDSSKHSGSAGKKVKRVQ